MMSILPFFYSISFYSKIMRVTICVIATIATQSRTVNRDSSPDLVKMCEIGFNLIVEYSTHSSNIDAGSKPRSKQQNYR